MIMKQYGKEMDMSCHSSTREKLVARLVIRIAAELVEIVSSKKKEKSD